MITVARRISFSAVVLFAPIATWNNLSLAINIPVSQQFSKSVQFFLLGIILGVLNLVVVQVAAKKEMRFKKSLIVELISSVVFIGLGTGLTAYFAG